MLPRVFLALLALPALLVAEPVPIIFDTDMDSDCDDVGALAMLHALADRGEAKILATVVSSHHPWSAPCTASINAYFGRPELPIGVPKQPGAIEQGSRYAKQIATEFPSPVKTAPLEATLVYRQVLAAQPDGSVVIVTVGDLTNLRYLLESGPDKASPLSGPELVRQKVKHWVCMGSRYPADLDPARWGNFKPDATSTVKAIAGWPTLITFTGGGAFAELLATGAGLAKLPVANPVRRAYELYFKGPPKSRHSADQISVYVAVRGTGTPWKLVTQGYNEIFPDGRHAWHEAPDNPLHEYISALAEGAEAKGLAQEIEGLMGHTPRAGR